MIKRVIQAVAALLSGLILAGYIGALHPLGDSLAVFRLWDAGALAAAALGLGVSGSARGAFLAAALALFAATPILSGMQRGGANPAPQVTVYVKNLGSARADVEGLLRDMSDSAPDIFLLQEVTRETAAILQEHLPGHPHWHICQVSGWSGMAVASRWPITDFACTPHRSVALAEIASPSGPIRAPSLHQVWPWPFAQAELLPQVLDILRSNAPRQIVAGDFNMVPWGQSVRAILRAARTHRISPVQTTLRIRRVPLAIDHVLTTGRGAVERRPEFGSDHYGLLARITFPD